MLLLALVLACASEPAPGPAAPTEPPVAFEPEPYEGPVPQTANCLFGDGTEAQVALVTRWPATLDVTLDDQPLRIDPETPGWKPYEYTGDVWYAFSVSFEALDAAWVYSVSGLAPDRPTPSLARTRAGVTDLAACDR